MPFDIKNLNPGIRFYWGEKEWVELRNIPMGEFRRIRKETVSRKVEYYKPDDASEKLQPFRYETDDIDDDKLNELLWDYQICDWHILDSDGNEIPCTLENKLLLMGNSTEFADWVVKNLNQLVVDEKDRKEKSEKN